MLLKIEKDSRQVPKVKEICASKKYYDVMYAYLQCNSEKRENGRFIAKKAVNFTRLAEIFGITRQTASTKFKNLKELGLVREYDANTYEVITLQKDIAALVPYETLKLITDSLSENSISTYVYLLNCYYANNCQPFQFTLEQIKHQIGICVTTRSNDSTVTNILYVLEKIGLMQYHLTSVRTGDDTFQNVKTIYQVDWLTNTIVKNLDA